MPIKVHWEGSLCVHHSLGMVNRELLLQLLSNQALSIRHIPYEPDQFDFRNYPRLLPLQKCIGNPHERPEITIRHRWPPDFSAAEGKLVLFQPWEYGSLPVEWYRKIREGIDEVWGYTAFLRKCYTDAGIDPSKVHIIPLGIDPDLFHPFQKPLSWVRELIGNRFCFLYNGGVTLRKGTDILVNAFLNEFGANEPVCLLIKDSNVYQKALSKKIEPLAHRDDIGRIFYCPKDIPPDDLPGLYTACHCYVQPYRAEGYGLPILEAMACDLPVIVSEGGASEDFIDKETAFRVRCSVQKMNEKMVSGIETIDYPFWLHPDMHHLQESMRYVYEDHEQAHRNAKKTGHLTRQKHTWTRSAQIVSERIMKLC